jgi:hypothetical protein
MKIKWHDTVVRVTRLLVYPVLEGTFVGQDFTFLEPQCDFLLGALDRVAAMAYIKADVLL